MPHMDDWFDVFQWGGWWPDTSSGSEDSWLLRLDTNTQVWLYLNVLAVCGCVVFTALLGFSAGLRPCLGPTILAELVLGSLWLVLRLRKAHSELDLRQAPPVTSKIDSPADNPHDR
jgi:hypothetical protein